MFYNKLKTVAAPFKFNSLKTGYIQFKSFNQMQILSLISSVVCNRNFVRIGLSLLPHNSVTEKGS